jgi:RIO-like serine/threonine protein kinase
VEKDGGGAVVKDYRPNGFLFRHIVGRFLVWREHKAYRRLRGMQGVPALYGVIDGLALVMEKIDGEPVEGLEKDRKLTDAFIRDLEALVERFHARGLAHCDLKRAPNILVDRNDRPFIVDWSAALSAREFRFFPLNRLYKRFLQDDFNALIKLRLRHCPQGVTPEERRQYLRRGPVERLVRRIRDRAREWLQRVA